MLNGNYPISELSNVEKRSNWVKSQLNRVISQYADGINIDIEDPTRNGTNDTHLLTELVGEVYSAFKSVNQNYQVCVCVCTCVRVELFQSLIM